MRLRFQLAMLLLAACGAAFAQSARPDQAAAARIDLIDRIVAVVNKEVITQYELAERMDRVQKELQRRGTSLPDRGEIERQVLERLIIEKVQLQYARETGVRVDDLELDRTVSRVAEGNKLSLTEFRKTLERDAINFDGFREELRNEILMNRLRDREVTGKITVSEGEIENLLLEQGERKDIATEYNIAHILVRVPEQASPEQLETRRARAEEAVKRLKDGAALLVEQAHVRHILIRTNELVSEDEAKRKLLSLRERIVNGVNFAELARLNSDDGSASRGGDLGWIYPGDTVAEFERAFTELKPMDVSQPVKTPFGWHLIQVLERRTADMSSERKRVEARKALLDRKGDEAYQEWLRQLRDRAYVEMRLEER